VGVSELRELRQLPDEVGRLERLVADLSLDRQILQDIVSKSYKASCASEVGALRRKRPIESASGTRRGS